MKLKNNKMLLSSIYFCSQPIDYEHKQYLLLAFVQKVKKGFAVNNLADFLYETRYHLKNIECFLTIRSLLELRDVPGPTEKEKEYFKEITSKPDDDKDMVEILKIANWSLKILQDTINEGVDIFSKIESNIRMYFIGKTMSKNTGYLIVRYAGSPVFESYKFKYDPSMQEVSFELFKYYDMPIKSDFGHVKEEILKDEDLQDDLFVAVESDKSYDTKKSIFPVLNKMFPTKIYSKNVLGLLH